MLQVPFPSRPDPFLRTKDNSLPKRFKTQKALVSAVAQIVPHWRANGTFCHTDIRRHRGHACATGAVSFDSFSDRAGELAFGCARPMVACIR
jgi:hypothetical protein